MRKPQAKQAQTVKDTWTAAPLLSVGTHGQTVDTAMKAITTLLDGPHTAGVTIAALKCLRTMCKPPTSTSIVGCTLIGYQDGKSKTD